jgi:hypothetical protein
MLSEINLQLFQLNIFRHKQWQEQWPAAAAAVGYQQQHYIKMLQ